MKQKNYDLITRYWHGGAKPLQIETMDETYKGFPIHVVFGEFEHNPDHPFQTCYAAVVYNDPTCPYLTNVLATDEGLGRLKAKVKKMTRPAAPAPTPTPAPRLSHVAPTVAEQVGLNLSFVEKVVDAMADIERQRRVAQALAVAQRKAAHASRQRMIAAGYIKPAQETA